MKRLLLAVLLFGCRGTHSGAPDASAAPCTRFGQTCVFAPGKLGTCVERACTKPPCGFECQSQH